MKSATGGEGASVSKVTAGFKIESTALVVSFVTKKCFFVALIKGQPEQTETLRRFLKEVEFFKEKTS